MENTKLTKAQQRLEVSNAISDSTIADKILNSMDKLVKQEALVIPKGYSMGNNMKLAYLEICKNDSLKGCTSASIGETLVEMVLQGLEITKKHCYFIKYGNNCSLFRSYFGDVSVLERTELVKPNTTKAVVVYDGDEIEVEIENDEEVLKSFKANPNVFERHNKAIVGVYAVTTLANGDKKYVFMSKQEIDSSWNKSKAQSKTTHKEFPQEMAKRTAIRRLAKTIINFSANNVELNDEQRQVINSYNRTTENEFIDLSKNDSNDNSRSNTSVPQSLLDLKEEPKEEPKKEVVEEKEEVVEDIPSEEEVAKEEPPFDDDFGNDDVDDQGNVKLF